MVLFMFLVEKRKERAEWSPIIMEKNAHVLKCKFHCLTADKPMFAPIVSSNGIERCARLRADDNFWPSSCKWSEANQGQKALSQLQTSAWCRRHQSDAIDTSSERAVGETPGGWWSISLSFSTSSHPSLFPPLLPHPPPAEPAVSGSMRRHCTLSHTLTGERGRRGVDREIWIWCQQSD